MSAFNSKNNPEAEWERIEAIMDGKIDTPTKPPTNFAFRKTKLGKTNRAKQKASVTLEVDADVLEWFKAQGEEFQTRINAALRIYAAAHHDLPSRH
ncbi:MAG: BrnA antitoxin family protein [Pseudanabaenales cyanobacterium]|nr:BrnA antitoxin family protein [Pseudanabaenales cyanobacterium]